MKKTAKDTIHTVSVLMVVAIGLVVASIASAASAHAQANNTSSVSAKNMTSASGAKSIIGTGGNNTKVIVTMEVKEGKKQEALKTLISLAELGRKRPGNISYNIYSSSENPNELILDQLWSSKAAFDKHYNSPEANQSRQAVTPLLVQPAQVKIYTEIS
ncbi:MAG TPA: putative quinol monooxygenase [Candidatus Nitrosopolaris sp.]|nr:putative quinol monooxygenase [Candidatus Nitrosopolaris sp.]